MRETTEASQTKEQSLPNAFIRIGSYTIHGTIDDIFRFLEEHREESVDPTSHIQLCKTFCSLLYDEIKQGKKMREVLERTVKNYLSSSVLPQLREKEGERMLDGFRCAWLHNECLPLSLEFILNHRYIPSSQHLLLQFLYHVCFNAFKDSIYLKVRDRVRDCIISMINEDREGMHVDKSLLENAVYIFMKNGRKEGEEEAEEDDGDDDDLEKHMIKETGVYYLNKASTWIQQYSCLEYMKIAQECLKQEEARAVRYFCPSTAVKLLRRLRHELLIVHQKLLLEKEGSGFKSLLAVGSFQGLSLVFQNYRSIPGTESLKQVAAAFRDSAVEEGSVVLQEACVVEEHVLLSRLFEIHERFSSYIRGCFNDHNLFLEALKDAFEMLCNGTLEETSIAEIFRTFLNNALTKKLIDGDTEQTLRKAAKFLVYMTERDLVSIFYGKKFKRELLCFDQSPNNVLTRLKQHSDNQFRYISESMLTDLISAKQNRDSFREFLAHNPSLDPGFDFTMTVITARLWPLYKTFDIKFPIEMEKSLQSFKRFYKKTTNRRKLIWVDSLGYCQLLGRFDEKPIDLIMTTHQAAVLLLFNSSDRLSFSDIVSHLNLFPKDLIGLLHSFCLDKYKILTKKPETKTISQSDVFEFNAKFTNTTRKIHLPPPTVAEEGKKLVEEVKGDRKSAIEAAIVRIMKGRKVLKLEELVLECTDQLRQSFRPDIKTIKNRVEALMEREFLERDPLDRRTFRYLP